MTNIKYFRHACALCLIILVAACAHKPPKPQVKAKSPQSGNAVMKVLNNTEPARPSAPQPATLLATARVLRAQERLEESDATLRRIIKESPGYTPAYNELAESQMARGRGAEALATLRAGLKKSPADPVLLNNAGLCLLASQDYAGSAVYFEKILKANPKNARATANLALARAMQGRTEEARRLYEQILTPAEARRNIEILKEMYDTAPSQPQGPDKLEWESLP